MDSSPKRPNKIYVLLVEHEINDHDNIMNMLHYFSYEVTSVESAATALSVLSKEKVQFDLVIANINTPDSYGFQLLQAALKMKLLVILTSNEDDAPTTMKALQEGAFLCVKKPVTMQILGYVWQHVSREKLSLLKEKEPAAASTKVIKYNPEAKELGQVRLPEGSGGNAEQTSKSQKKLMINSYGTSSQHDNVVYRRKVWTEWTLELHSKFMDAARQLGQGRCYPKDILELMNVPGLTRMQVASHLQKCRNAKWLPPHERKSKQGNTETSITISRENKPPRSKPASFGSMPFVEDNSTQFHLGPLIQQHHDQMNLQAELALDPYNRIESSNNIGYPPPPQNLLDYGNMNPFAQDNIEIFNNMQGQLLEQAAFGMDDQPLVYGTAQSLAPLTHVPSNDIITENALGLSAVMDPMMVNQNFCDFQQFELGMDYNGSWQSLILDQDHNDYHQIPTHVSTNATNRWIHGGFQSVLVNPETEGRMRE